MVDFRVVGKPIGSADGEGKVSGKTVYTADFSPSDMLWAKCLRSQLPHARIVEVDVSRAKSFPGVHAVLTAEDIPTTRVGRRLEDMPMLARNRVRFVGEKIAVVAAENPNVAEEAVHLIDVQYEELPATFDPLEAIRDGSSALHKELDSYEGSAYSSASLPNVQSHMHWGIGDVDQGFRESDEIFESKQNRQVWSCVNLHPLDCRQNHPGRLKLTSTI